MQPKKLVKIAAFSITAGLVFPAYSATERILNGSVCDHAFAGNFGRLKSFVTGFQNNDTNPFAALVTCPLVRVNPTNLTGLTSVKIRVNDTSSTSEVNCTVYSNDKHGTNNATLSGGSGGSFVGHKEIPILGPTSGFSGGHYALSCSVPNGSWINSIDYVEP
jgi:hypothetical protein